MATTFAVDGIIETIGTKMGLTVGTDGIDDACYGIIINAQKTYTQFLAQHKSVFNYLIVDDIIDVPIIRVVRRAVNADLEIDVTVQEADCIIRGLDQPSIKYVRTDPIALPRSVELQYVSFDRSFSVNTQYARNEGARVQQGIFSARCDFILGDQQARELAYDLLYRIWSQQLTLSFEHPDLRIEPSDIVEMVTNQGTYITQILSSMITKEPNGSSGVGRTNQLVAQLLLTKRGVATAAGQVNTNSSVGFFHIISRATVAGIGAEERTSIGSAAGTSTAVAVGRSTARSAGSSAGTSTAPGIGASIAVGAGSAAGVGDAHGSSSVPSSGDGLAAGTSTALGVGGSLVSGAGAASSTSSASGIGSSAALSDGSASGVGTATGVALSFSVGFSQSLTTDMTGWAGVNLRQVINSSLLSGSGTHIRVTLTAAVGSHSAIVDSAYIYQQAGSGDAYDGNNATKTQLLVSGSGSFTIAQGTSVVTDDTTFTWDSTKNHVLAFHFGGTFSEIKTTVLFGGPSGAQGYFKAGSDEAATADVSTYTTGATALYFVAEIEFY